MEDVSYMSPSYPLGEKYEVILEHAGGLKVMGVSLIEPRGLIKVDTGSLL